MYGGAQYTFVEHGSCLIYTHVYKSGIINRALDTLMEIQAKWQICLPF